MIQSMYLATSANTVYFELSQLLVLPSSSAEETTPLRNQALSLFIIKPPPLSPVHGPELLESPTNKPLKKQTYDEKNLFVDTRTKSPIRR